MAVFRFPAILKLQRTKTFSPQPSQDQEANSYPAQARIAQCSLCATGIPRHWGKLAKQHLNERPVDIEYVLVDCE